MLTRKNILILSVFSQIWSSETFLNTADEWNSQRRFFSLKAQRDNVCYKYVGCFSMRSPWRSFLRPLPNPKSPEEISTKFYFYSYPNTKKRQHIHVHPEVSVKTTNFVGSKSTVIITHGFWSSGSVKWIEDLKDAYLRLVNANAIIVDWEDGASGYNYLQVASNARVVGKEVARVIKHIILHEGVDPSQIHLIGHSVGAHVLSYAAKSVSGISRLTALDPAQPGFEGHSKMVRLDRSDADFVEVIHTDAIPFIPTLGFGMMLPHGHVDFYMNGGFHQPACSKTEDSPQITSLEELKDLTVDIFTKYISCNHQMSYRYFTEALLRADECIFWGHEINTSFSTRKFFDYIIRVVVRTFSKTCSLRNCVPLGLLSSTTKLRGSFNVVTNAESPYCIKEFHTARELENEMSSRKGNQRIFFDYERNDPFEYISRKYFEFS